jgi:DNA-binding GntR family transcriptional regulator
VTLEIKNIEQPSRLSEIAYDAIKAAILSAKQDDFAKGGRIDERALANQLGISRTPVREAISRLMMEGFVKIVPRQGIYLAVKSKTEIIEILLVRSVLEGLAARLAAEHATKGDLVKMKAIFTPFLEVNLHNRVAEYSQANIAFHEAVLENSRCGKLVEMAGNLFEQMRIIRTQTANYPDRPKISLSQHLKIIEAIEKKDGDLAERLMQRHLEEVIKDVEENARSLEEWRK